MYLTLIPKEYEMPTGLNSHLSIKDCSRVCQKSSYQHNNKHPHKPHTCGVKVYFTCMCDKHCFIPRVIFFGGEEGGSSHSRVFHSYGDVIIAVEGQHIILTYAQHSWSLSSKGSQRVTPTVTWGIYLIWSSPRTRDTGTYCQAFAG